MVWVSPVIPWDMCDGERQFALRVLWERGDLAYKLHPSQLEVYEQIKASWRKAKGSLTRVFALDVSRQWGKDFLCAVMAVETLYRHRLMKKKALATYGAPTGDACVELLAPTVETVFDDCPPELRPKELKDGTFTRSAKQLTLPGGRQRLRLVGCELHPHRLRGNSLVAAFLSECGFMAVASLLAIVLPAFQWNPEGFTILNSSPPDTPAHEWDTEVLPECQAREMYATRNIYDNPALSEDQRNDAIEGMGGPESDRCRRELFCEHIANSERLVIPEWRDVRGVSDGAGCYTGGCVTTPTLPKYRDCYISMDPGWSDMCAVLFASYDYLRGVLVVEDDIAVPQTNSALIADMIREKETALWGVEWTEHEYKDATGRTRYRWSAKRGPGSVSAWRDGALVHQPLKRVSDTDLRMIGDMGELHGLPFQPTRKDDRDAAINGLRVRVKSGLIEVMPAAKHTIAHLDHGIWNKAKTKFEQSGKHGHFDALAALIYLDRNVDRHRDPFPPPLYGVDTSNMLVHEHMLKKPTPLAAMFPKSVALHAERKRRQQNRPRI